MKSPPIYLLLILCSFALFGQGEENRGFVRVKVSSESKAQTLYENSYALVIGNSDYSSEWKSLPGVREDINRISMALKESGFEVTIGENYTKQQLDSAFSAFISTYGNQLNSRLLFYFAGHGYTVNTSYGDQLGYIVPIGSPRPDDDPGKFQGAALEMAQIEIYAKRLQSKHALFVFDACFAGSIFSQTRGVSEDISFKTISPVRQFITSGDENEVVPDKSIFCNQLIKAISTSEADGNKDGYLTGTELGEYLQKTVIAKSDGKQHPQYGKIRNPSLDKGDFVFVVNKDLRDTISYNSPTVGRIERLMTSGSLKIESKLSGELFIDNISFGRIHYDSTKFIRQLPTGKHHMRIEGAENFWSTIFINPEQEKTMVVHPYFNKSRDLAFMKMIYVEGGEFNMGDSLGLPDQNPVHQVSLNDFEIGAYEVTIRQFSAFVKETSYVTEAEKGTGTSLTIGSNGSLKRTNGINWQYQANGVKAKDLSQPVVFISWNDANEFTKWMTKKYPGTFRLPTEAEWEYAASGGARRKLTKYAGSDSLNAVSRQHSTVVNFTTTRSTPNELGIYDMTGSVSEWCYDWYDKNFYRKSPFKKPIGPNDGGFKVLRGGSQYSGIDASSIHFRDKTNPENYSFSDGFRVVRILR